MDAAVAKTAPRSPCLSALCTLVFTQFFIAIRFMICWCACGMHAGAAKVRVIVSAS